MDGETTRKKGIDTDADTDSDSVEGRQLELACAEVP